MLKQVVACLLLVPAFALGMVSCTTPGPAQDLTSTGEGAAETTDVNQLSFINRVGDMAMYTRDLESGRTVVLVEGESIHNVGYSDGELLPDGSSILTGPGQGMVRRSKDGVITPLLGPESTGGSVDVDESGSLIAYLHPLEWLEGAPTRCGIGLYELETGSTRPLVEDTRSTVILGWHRERVLFWWQDEPITVCAVDLDGSIETVVQPDNLSAFLGFRRGLLAYRVKGDAIAVLVVATGGLQTFPGARSFRWTETGPEAVIDGVRKVLVEHSEGPG